MQELLKLLKGLLKISVNPSFNVLIKLVIKKPPSIMLGGTLATNKKIITNMFFVSCLRWYYPDQVKRVNDKSFLSSKAPLALNYYIIYKLYKNWI